MIDEKDKVYFGPGTPEDNTPHSPTLETSGHLALRADEIDHRDKPALPVPAEQLAVIIHEIVKGADLRS